ncbi:hypothetical protein MERGE_000194 [Pneumocystis wakefieldiae]|uniref:Ribosomal RNA-processing protein 42 n=1 Tax=Pneumocystis wakefieldiae TaxID=38082 RepID=A0A899FXQ9_9ASCO|nr:hypothetical protein MERGE_000194 [Pneumocystis wakefieldiae]
MSAFLTQSLQQFLSGIRPECLLVASTKAWNIFIDAVVISSNSHSLPALALAVYLALQTARLPHIVAHIAPEHINSGENIQNIGSGEFEVDYDLKNSVPIPDIEKVGVVIFVGNVGENILYDLSGDEMAVTDGLLAVGVLQNGQIAYTRRICISSAQRRSCLKRSIIKNMLEGAVVMGKELIRKSKEDIINQADNNRIGDSIDVLKCLNSQHKIF